MKNYIYILMAFLFIQCQSQSKYEKIETKFLSYINDVNNNKDSIILETLKKDSKISYAIVNGSYFGEITSSEYPEEFIFVYNKRNQVFNDSLIYDFEISEGKNKENKKFYLVDISTTPIKSIKVNNEGEIPGISQKMNNSISILYFDNGD